MHPPGCSPLHCEAEDDNNGVFLHDSDIIHEDFVDSEVLPDADVTSETEGEELGGNGGDFIHKFTAHARAFYSVDRSPTVAYEGMDTEDLPNVDDDSEDECFWELCSVACSPLDATMVATGGRDDKGFLWKIGQEDEHAFELRGHKDSIASLAFSYDGQLLASGCLGGIIKVWDVSGNLEVA